MQGGNRQPLITEEPKVKRLGNVYDGSSPKHNNRVIEFAKEVVNSGVLETESAEIYSYDGYNNKMNKSDCIGTVVPQNSRWGLTNGYKIVEVEPNNKTIENCYVSEKGVKYILDSKRGMATDVNADICQPLTAKGQANWTGSFVSPDIESLEKSSTIGSTEPTKINLKNGETITSNDNLSSLRIRKLTPKECWRLMGFTDEDFEKAAQYNSNSQLYKQAGNSIVVSVLYYIFKGML
jgi:site-specific DNA-cytosine methylase